MNIVYHGNCFQRCFFIWLEARLQPNIEFNLRHVLAVFTRSALSVESEPMWMKSGALWVHCWGLALADFGCDPPSRDSWRARRILFFFCQVSNARFHRFPLGQISRNLNGDRCRDKKLSEQNFENFTVMGRFSKKTQKFRKIFLMSCDFRPL